MEFNKSKVYTALNADELKIGSKVICANDLDSLKQRVSAECEVSTLKGVFDESHERRFQIESRGAWPLVYLISEPEETWIAYLYRRKSIKPYLTACRSDCWEEVQKEYGAKTKLFEGTEDEVGKWYVARRQFADVIAAWEDGKTIRYNSGNGWEDCCDNRPVWDVTSKYRIKPEGLKWTDLKIGDIVHRIDTDISDVDVEAMVVAIDKNPATGFHVMIANEWTTDKRLAKCWEKVEKD